MTNIKLDETPKTPSVSFNSEDGILEIRGRSIPENSFDFFTPLNDWIKKYSESPQPETIFNVKLEYFNTSSSKFLLELFRLLDSINGKGTDVIVNWYFEKDDVDMEEAGEDYNSIITLPLNIIEIDEI